MATHLANDLFVVFVEVSMNKIALWISIRANDWTAESTMSASNRISFLVRLEMKIIEVWFVIK